MRRKKNEQNDNNGNTKNTKSKSTFNSLKNAMKEVQKVAKIEMPSVSRFNQWDKDQLKNLLVENNVQIRNSASATHATLVRICDEVFGPEDDDDYDDDSRHDHDGGEGGGDNNSNGNGSGGLNLNSTFSFEDLAKMNWAAIKIQNVFIASRARQQQLIFESAFSQNQEYYPHVVTSTNDEQPYQVANHDYDQNQNGYQNGDQDGYQNEYDDNDQGEHQYYDDEQQDQYQYDNELPAPSAPAHDGEEMYYEHPPLHEEGTQEGYSYGEYQEGNNISGEASVGDEEHFSGAEEEPIDELDKELDAEWRKPSWKFAKKYEADNRPHKSGKSMKKYSWRKDTLGRHCPMGGCGEQLDLWNEGATSEFSQFGSGITNYFKVSYIRTTLKNTGSEDNLLTIQTVTNVHLKTFSCSF
jgi:hypothetical protein